MPSTREMVQLGISCRKELGKTYSGKSALSAKLVCEACGAFYDAKVWHSTDQYWKQLWQCNRKFSNEKRCGTPTIDNETIRRMFRTAYNQLVGNRAEIIVDCQQMWKELVDFAMLDVEIAEKMKKIQLIAKLVQEFVTEPSFKGAHPPEKMHTHRPFVKRFSTKNANRL